MKLKEKCAKNISDSLCTILFITFLYEDIKYYFLHQCFGNKKTNKMIHNTLALLNSKIHQVAYKKRAMK